MSTSSKFFVVIVLVSTLVGIVVSNKTREIRSLSNEKKTLKPSSSDRLDWTIESIKCATNIVSKQMIRYHSNAITCCSLWKIKSFLIGIAKLCDRPEDKIAVLDNLITEKLVYSDLIRSLLNESSLNCNSYSEGSKSCEQLNTIFYLFLTLFVLIIIFIFFGFIVPLSRLIHWSRNCAELQAQTEDYFSRIGNQIGNRQIGSVNRRIRSSRSVASNLGKKTGDFARMGIGRVPIRERRKIPNEWRLVSSDVPMELDEESIELETGS